MSANVETMFSVREKPWHGLGVIVQEAPNSSEALRLAELDWTVRKMPIMALDEANDLQLIKIPDMYANIRSSDNKSLGIVTDKYKIVQNSEAFEFTDNLIGGDVRYETAGSLNGGKRVWLMAKMPSVQVAGDEVEPYLVFTNTFDGSGAVRACMTPIRVVCNNTLNFALSTAKRNWKMCHKGDIDGKQKVARESLGIAEIYMQNLERYAEKMANTKCSIDEAVDVIKQINPIMDKDSELVKERKEELYKDYIACWFAPDLYKFVGTAWGAVNAISDLATHRKPTRITETAQENVFSDVLGGHPMIDAFQKELQKRLAIRV